MQQAKKSRGLQKPRVLLVDDEPSYIFILTGALTERYEVEYACDATAALALIDQHGSDLSLVILDITIPADADSSHAEKKNGCLVALKVKDIDGNNGFEKIPLLLITGYKEYAPYIQEAVGKADLPCLFKPLIIGEVMEIVEKEITKRNLITPKGP